MEEPTNYPVTLTIQRGEERFSINGVREDSISSKRDKLGNIVLSFELYSNPDAIGYVPCIDWYVTELEG